MLRDSSKQFRLYVDASKFALVAIFKETTWIHYGTGSRVHPYPVSSKMQNSPTLQNDTEIVARVGEEN